MSHPDYTRRFNVGQRVEVYENPLKIFSNALPSEVEQFNHGAWVEGIVVGVRASRSPPGFEYNINLVEPYYFRSKRNPLGLATGDPFDQLVGGWYHPNSIRGVSRKFSEERARRDDYNFRRGSR